MLRLKQIQSMIVTQRVTSSFSNPFLVMITTTTQRKETYSSNLRVTGSSSSPSPFMASSQKMDMRRRKLIHSAIKPKNNFSSSGFKSHSSVSKTCPNRSHGDCGVKSGSGSGNHAQSERHHILCNSSDLKRPSIIKLLSPIVFWLLFGFISIHYYLQRSPTVAVLADTTQIVNHGDDDDQSDDGNFSADEDEENSSSCEDSDADEEKVNYRRTLFSDAQFLLIKLLPLKLVSRIWGWINSVPLPTFLRVQIIKLYSSAFGCNLEEAEVQDLTQYKNLGQFFRRSLKPGVRPIDATSDIVSPADGTMVHFGKVENERIEQIKGVDYSLRSFLGPQTWTSRRNSMADNDSEYHQNLLTRKNTSLYHCVIYLAPGDYHRFHSPTDWTVNFRRHFSGKLLSIRPSFMSWIQDLFTLNERVAYLGRWTHGFFSMTAVGATNVGSVRVYFDEKLKTNTIRCRIGTYRDHMLPEGISRSKGQDFGEFNLGSTIVLIFEAPEDFICAAAPGSKIKYGQKLFSSRNHDSKSG